MEFIPTNYLQFIFISSLSDSAIIFVYQKVVLVMLNCYVFYPPVHFSSPPIIMVVQSLAQLNLFMMNFSELMNLFVFSSPFANQSLLEISIVLIYSRLTLGMWCYCLQVPYYHLTYFEQLHQAQILVYAPLTQLISLCSYLQDQVTSYVFYDHQKDLYCLLFMLSC